MEEIAASDTDETEKDKDAQVSQACVSVGVLPAGVGYCSSYAEETYDEKCRNTLKTNDIVTYAKKSYPRDEGENAENEHGVTHGRQADSSTLDGSLRTYTICTICAMDSIAIIIAEVGENLKKEGGCQLENENGCGKARILECDSCACEDNGERERERPKAEGRDPCGYFGHSENMICLKSNKVRSRLGF